jgi:hypothetical protein
MKAFLLQGLGYENAPAAADASNHAWLNNERGRANAPILDSRRSGPI